MRDFETIVLSLSLNYSVFVGLLAVVLGEPCLRRRWSLDAASCALSVFDPQAVVLETWYEGLRQLQMQKGLAAIDGSQEKLELLPYGHWRRLAQRAHDCAERRETLAFCPHSVLVQAIANRLVATKGTLTDAEAEADRFLLCKKELILGGEAQSCDGEKKSFADRWQQGGDASWFKQCSH